MYIVSACLMGVNCKYSGGNNKSEEVIDFLKDKEFTLVCPEQLGGLATPRVPVEIVNGEYLNKVGENVSTNFINGANETLKIIKMYKNIELIILKDGSPSCGSERIYDGTFSNIKIDGMGCTAKLLMEKGYKIKSENDF
ncbi:DUF523 domain-containing protein [Clostridiaceae bacterium HSG29]|nr:DUF523 domain-containing protein [Clostridiaceae bacterium HSG29]